MSGSAHRLSIIVFAAALTACAAKDPARISSAASTPLNDFNLMQNEIPAVLLAAQKQPYQLPVEQSCVALTEQIYALDMALGPDLDTPPSETDPSLIERGSEMADDAAIDALQSTAESIVPFRSWVRRLSGAAAYSRQVAAAIAAGMVRRAFLKGLVQAHGCPNNTLINTGKSPRNPQY